MTLKRLMVSSIPFCFSALSGFGQWQNLDSGLFYIDMPIYDRVVLEYDQASSRLYAIGRFTHAGSAYQAMNYAAYFENGEWFALGSGTNFPAYDAQLWNGDLYVGGQFSLAGGVAGTQYIARWSVDHWESVGVFNGLVEGFDVLGGELYAFGDFDTINGMPVDHVAKLSGTQWIDPFPSLDLSSVNNGSYFLDLEVFQGDTLAAGIFYWTNYMGVAKILGDTLIEIPNDPWTLGGGVSEMVVFDDVLYCTGIIPSFYAFDGINWLQPFLPIWANAGVGRGLKVSNDRLVVNLYNYHFNPPIIGLEAGSIITYDGFNVCVYGGDRSATSSGFVEPSIMAVSGDSVFSVFSDAPNMNGVALFDISTSNADTCWTLSVGIEEFADSALKLYPNPTENELVITWPEHWAEGAKVRLEILDIRGRSVRNASVPINGSSSTIDVSPLAEGAYVLTASYGYKVARAIFVKE